MSDTKIAAEVQRRLALEWPKFAHLRREIMTQTEAGRRLSERDVEQVLEALVTGPLGWNIGQLARQQDFADFALIDRGLKLAVIEAKGFGAFEDDSAVENALVQGARYADRHRTPIIWACDGCELVLASRDASAETITVHLRVPLGGEEAPGELYYFTHYGLFRYPRQALKVIPYSAAQDEALYKRHHGVLLHYSCFAYVGDLRDKATWLMPYRTPDGSVDTARLGHAVNFLLSPGGYRGQKADAKRIPQAATLLCALRLAQAYAEIGRWHKPEKPFSGGEKPDPQTILWLYLHQHGIDQPGGLFAAYAVLRAPRSETHCSLPRDAQIEPTVPAPPGEDSGKPRNALG